ncbi:FAD-dependent oxidoreductase [Aegicerativicinus sediminis]
MNSRERLVSKLESTAKWDIIVIGGGASGLGVAVEAASRGLNTLLLEQYDFAKGTSSKSTKLLHGGVRYLAQGDVGLVIEALRERGHLKTNAKHLFVNQEFIIPNYNWWFGGYYWLGLKMYDWLSTKLSLGSSKFLSKRKVLDMLPTLKTEGLDNGVTYHDGQFDDARLAINLVQTAIEKGAIPLNYFKVLDFNKNDKNQIVSLEVRDVESSKTYTVSGSVIVNATGIFTDKILKLYRPNHKKTVVPSQGIHIVLDNKILKSTKGIMIPKTSDGRVLFVIPWYDKVIVGTTDTPIKKPKIEPKALEFEIDFILDTLNHYLDCEVGRDDIYSIFAGLRPLAKPEKEESTKDVSRSHKINIDGNLLSIVGGKWTTYRKIGEDVVDSIAKNFSMKCGSSITLSLSIHGNVKDLIEGPNHLIFYGSDLPEFLKFQESNPKYSEIIHPKFNFTIGQIVWSIRFEFARTVEDFLSRRIRMLLLDAKSAIEAAPKVAEVMAEELAYSDQWKKEQIQQFTQLTNSYYLP